MTPMPRLLLVDDDTDILALLSAFFRKHGHVVTTATGGAAMFEVLGRELSDLVILDVMLQDEDGFSLCRNRRCRARPQCGANHHSWARRRD
jgi:two-component system, OmpR family, response regulator